MTLWGPYPVDRWAEPSRAVVASDGHGHGCILYTEGPHLRSEMVELGRRALSELMLDDTPAGIWVWVGRIVGVEHPATSNGPAEWDTEMVDEEMRPPTDDEWAAIREGRSPWPDPWWDETEKEKER